MNFSPLLSNLIGGFTTLIFYEAIDFGPTELPIATMTPKYAYFERSSCVITDEQVSKIAYLGGLYVHVRICPTVNDNYHIKGTRCVGVMSSAISISKIKNMIETNKMLCTHQKAWEKLTCIGI